MTPHNPRHEHDHGDGGHAHSHEPTPEDLAAAPVGDVTECPVMAGTTVIKSQAERAGLYRDYREQRYWLCCAACGPLFEVDPDRYATTG